MIHEQICTYEVCQLAKEKGFPLQKVIKQDGRAFFYELPQSHPDWANCDAWYLPTQSLLQRWLREEKGLHIAVFPNMANSFEFDYIVYNKGDKFWNPIYTVHSDFATYELALEDALKYVLENLV